MKEHLKSTEPQNKSKDVKPSLSNKPGKINVDTAVRCTENVCLASILKSSFYLPLRFYPAFCFFINAALENLY